jgi:HEAT repeat protein
MRTVSRTGLALLLSAFWACAHPACAEELFQGKPLAEWARLLYSDKQEEIADALAAIRHFGPKAGAAVPGLLHLTEQTDRLCHAALRTIEELGPAARPALPRVIKLLGYPEELIAQQAQFTLRRLERVAGEAIPDLLKALEPNARYSKGFVRMLPETLHAIAPGDPRVQQALTGALAHHDLGVQIEAGRVLLRRDQCCKALLRRLKEGVTAEETTVRLIALEGAKEMATQAKPILPRVCVARWDPSLDVRCECIAAIQAIDRNAPETIETLLRALDDPEWLVRSRAATALSNVSDPDSAKRRTERLLLRLKDEDKFVRVSACCALWKMDRQNLPEVLSVLIAALQCKDCPETRSYACKACGAIGPPAKAAVPALERLRDDDEWGDVRSAATAALRQITGR